jgi:hypothetical protein
MGDRVRRNDAGGEWLEHFDVSFDGFQLPTAVAAIPLQIQGKVFC